MRSKIVLALLGFLTMGGAIAAGSDQTSVHFCSFSYTREIQQEDIIPVLRQKFGEGYQFFDYEDPMIIREFGEVQIHLGAIKTINGERLLDENPVVIVIDPCTQKVLRSFIVNEYQRD